MINSVQGFHIEPTNICTLQCPGCSRTQFIKQWPQHWSNHSLDIDSLFNFLDIDLHNKKIILSGNYGDPIYHPDILTLVKELNKKSYNIRQTTFSKILKQAEIINFYQTLDQQPVCQYNCPNTCG